MVGYTILQCIALSRRSKTSDFMSNLIIFSQDVNCELLREMLAHREIVIFSANSPRGCDVTLRLIRVCCM